MKDPDVTQQLLDWVRSHYFGKYRGTVTDNSDPTGRGRLKVTVPALLDTLEVWAMPCVPYAGAQVGFYSLPEPQTGVWVEFEGGDVSYPIWTGCFWGDDELPDQNDAAIKIWKTEKLTVRLDDSAEELVVTTNDAKMTLTSEAKIEAGGATETVGSSGVVSDSGGTGKVEVSSSSVKVNSGALEVT